MEPKASKGKEVPKASKGKEVLESELVKMRKKHVVFAPTLDARALKERYLCMWGRATTGHPATRVIPASCAKAASDKFSFFVDYFYCGLCPPFSDFLNDIMYTYGFHILDFMPNAVTCMSVFAHLCENFAGVVPNTALFCHYFIPRIQAGEALSGCVAWIPRAWNKDVYPEGVYREKWDEWRGRWCWITEQDPQPFCMPRQTRLIRDNGWSTLDP
jgi:hypothetical protein